MLLWEGGTGDECLVHAVCLFDDKYSVRVGQD